MFLFILLALSFLLLPEMASPLLIPTITEIHVHPHRDVSQETQQRISLEMRQGVLDNRKRNTKSSYGDTAALTSGPAKEWST